MIKNSQKGLLHIYPDYAELSDPDRRNVLAEKAGVASSADRQMTQAGFEKAMAAYEAILWHRVDEGIVADPRDCRRCASRMLRGRKKDYCPACGEHRKVYAWSRTHWRDKLPDAGQANSRQLHKVRELWGLLTDFLPEQKCNERYLGAIAAKACGRAAPILLHNLSRHQAHLTIEALKDRLRHAVKN